MRVAAGAAFLLFASTEYANAAFVPAFLGGLLTEVGLTGLGGAVFGLGGGAGFGAFAAGASFGTFLTSPIGSLRRAWLDKARHEHF